MEQPSALQSSFGAVVTRKGVCKFCGAGCAIELDVRDNKLVAVRGDAADPIYGGYTCLKGRALPEAVNHPARLLATQKRRARGKFEPIATSTAIEEIGERLKTVISEHGPASVALYVGTYGFMNAMMGMLAPAFMDALGSHHFYSSFTIDQPVKSLCASDMGQWDAGFDNFTDAEAVIILGNNVLVSHYSARGGISFTSPSNAIREARRRGTKIIVVDPRRTEVARRADLHLQSRPGTDTTLLAGILNIILCEGLHDAEFCASHVDGLDELRSVVAMFTPARVAEICGIAVEQFLEAARIFGSAKRGLVTTGTGPEMAGNGMATEYLAIALNIVCARVLRAGEISNRQPVLMPAPVARAQPISPMRTWGEGHPASRFRGLTAMSGHMPCSVLADEILTPGPGQVRALIVCGGNPVTAFPDQPRIARALESLDLLVSLDTRMSETARRAHYVIAPSMSPERDDASMGAELFGVTDKQPYAFYASAAIPAPGDTIDDTEFLRQIAGHLNLSIGLPGGVLPVKGPLSKFEMLEFVTAGGPVPLAKVRAETLNGAKIYEECRVRVAAGGPTDERLNVAPDHLIAALGELAAVPQETPEAGYDYLCTVRRTKHYTNSNGHDLESLRNHGRTNPAFMHPDDLRALGVEEGTVLKISASKDHWIYALAKSDPDLRRGIVSISHGFGGTATTVGDIAEVGFSTNRLVKSDEVDAITGMPRLSAIPVRLSPAACPAPA